MLARRFGENEVILRAEPPRVGERHPQVGGCTPSSPHPRGLSVVAVRGLSALVLGLSQGEGQGDSRGESVKEGMLSTERLEL